MDEEGATLSVGFTIDTGDSFGSLAQLERAMGSTEAKVVAEAASIERATNGMLNLAGSTAQVKAFNVEATGALQSVARESAKTEKAGEAMIRNLQRQAETYGKTAAEIRNMRAEQRAVAAESQGLTELADRIRGANAAIVSLEGGMVKSSNAAVKNRMAMQGASYQIQDFMTQVSMGANPLNAFAVQGGQLAGQFSMVEGKAGNVARFFMGPWGLAITFGLMALGPLVSKLMNMNSELDDAVDKLKKDAQQTDIARQAKERFQTSAEGVAAAIRDGTDATNKSIKALESSAEQANIEANNNVAREVSIRRVTMALLEKAKAEAASANGINFGAAGGAGAGAAQSIYAGRAADLQRMVDDQGKLILEAERRVQATRVDLAVESAKRMVDPLERIKKLYDDQVKAAKAAAYAQAGAGGQVTSQLSLQIAAIERNRNAAVKAEQDKQRALKDTADQIGRNITLQEGRSIAQSVGGRITSDHRDRAEQERLYAKYMAYKSGNGPWAALAAKPGTSMHELDQAVDVAKSDGVTLKKLIGAYRAAGVKLVEALDEGDHYHIAWKKVGDAAKAQTTEASAAAKAVRDAARAAQQQVDDAQSFASNLNDETGKIGKTAVEIKQIEVAAAAAKAPTEALREAIYAAGSAWETATSMHSMSGEDLSKSLTDGVRSISLKDLMPEVSIVNDSDHMIEALRAIAVEADTTGQALTNAFGNVGNVIGSLVADLADFQAAQAKVAAMPFGDERVKAEKALAVQQSRNIAQGIAGIKSLFKEHSTAYRVMSAVEKAYAALQLVNTIRSIALDTTKTASSVANSGARATADGVAAVAKAIASLPFPLNLVAGAATAAALVAFGVQMFGGGGGGSSVPTAPTSEDIQAKQGTGTVLGDSKAKSDSIAKSLELVASNTNKDLEYTNNMLRSLRSIDNGISKLAGTVAQQIQVAGSMFDTSRLNLGSSGSGGFLGIGKKTTTRTLWDEGLNLASSSVASIIADGITGLAYQVVQRVHTSSGFLGIGGGTHTTYETTNTAIDPAITNAIRDVVTSLRNGLVSAAGVIGIDGAQAIIDGFQVTLGQISFKDMTGDEIESTLNAVFSSLGDNMAGAIFPMLVNMQKVGEGLFETFMRVAREYEVVDIALKSIGRTFGAVGTSSVEARDALVQLFGSMDDFVEATDFFRDQFLTEAERIVPIAASVREELARLGMTGIQTRDDFKAAVLGLDLTSAVGREMYASLLAVAPAFDKVIDYLDQANKKNNDALKATVDQFTAFVTSLTKYRETLTGLTQTQEQSYARLKAQFTSTAALAANGDATALGGLENSAKAFLDASKLNSRSLVDYQRDVAAVARGVDAGIFAADATADYAQLQLDAANKANDILSSINQNTADMLAVPVYVAPPSSIQDTTALQDEVAGLRADLNSGLLAVAQNTSLTSRLLTRFDGDGLLIRTDADTPISTVAV